MNKEDGRKKQPFNKIDTECLDYIVNELKNNKSMQQMLNYYKGKYYRDRYWELKKQVDKAIEYIKDLDKNKFETDDDVIVLDNYLSDLLDILRGEDVSNKDIEYQIYKKELDRELKKVNSIEEFLRGEEDENNNI